MGADINPARKRHHQILDLGCDRIQFHCPFRSTHQELSCDESVIRRAHGQELVSALAKLAVPEGAGLLQAAASSHLSYRLARLTGPAQATLSRGKPALVIPVCHHHCGRNRSCCFILKH
jgi:hypothetical protein